MFILLVYIYFICILSFLLIQNKIQLAIKEEITQNSTGWQGEMMVQPVLASAQCLDGNKAKVHNALTCHNPGPSSVGRQESPEILRPLVRVLHWVTWHICMGIRLLMSIIQPYEWQRQAISGKSCLVSNLRIIRFKNYVKALETNPMFAVVVICPDHCHWNLLNEPRSHSCGHFSLSLMVTRSQS